ncbi:MAG: MarR family winged helix-turn-helix transcriptional regulator [Chthoniobacteraceae bacterium]
MNEKNRNRAHFGRVVISISRLWRRLADQALADCGLSQAMALPLLVLTRNDHVRQGAIADELGLEGPSLVRIIDLLVAEKLITRKEDATDRRAKILSLTEKGRERGLEIERVVDGMRKQFMAKVPKEDLALTVKTLEAVEQTLLGIISEKEGND